MSEAQRIQNEMNDLGEIYRLKGELLELRDERDRLRAALEVAGDAICSEFCGSGPCHKKCLAVKAALTPAEKMKDFEAAAGAMSCKEIADKVAGYTQLQALVRAFFTSEDKWAVAYRELERLGYTLDVTTPATMDAAETHDRMFNHADRHPEAL